jgi:hypothetical protein
MTPKLYHGSMEGGVQEHEFTDGKDMGARNPSAGGSRN